MREEQAALNTDREIWRKGEGDGNGMSYYEPSIHVTEHGAIGINVGGSVYVRSVEAWHSLAQKASVETSPTAPVWKRVLVKLKLGRWALWLVEEWV